MPYPTERSTELSRAREELYHALGRCYTHARRQRAIYEAQIGQKPIPSWDQEKHDQYYTRERDLCDDASRWLHTEMMRIDPD